MTAARMLLATAIAASGGGAAVAQDDAGTSRDATGTMRELAPVRVIGQRIREDPFAFRNPVRVEDTVFSRDWDEPPGLEEIGLRGGLVQMGINRGLELAAGGIRRLPGWQDQIVGAQARPPPLDEAQRDRAVRLHGEGESPPVTEPSGAIPPR
ncbi:hypothetical protein [Luteimonas kalidii]|uniref:Uncharacterized protein n=1 Tax=Luteimonas kalidii TaxID=3042025 RepID=A0ABT6JRG1_9GAMM|nr:hypothetical protein [Luteimonas kalidii]MDH5833177.1 hypothetical protein [Luteimonas kalidii]